MALITGTGLVSSTLQDCWHCACPTARVVTVGATVCLLSDAFLRRGVDVVAGVRVTDPASFLDILAEGGSGYHVFR